MRLIVIHPPNPKDRKPIMHRWDYEIDPALQHPQRERPIPEMLPAYDPSAQATTQCSAYAVSKDIRRKDGTVMSFERGFKISRRDGKPVSTYVWHRRSQAKVFPALTPLADLQADPEYFQEMSVAHDMGTSVLIPKFAAILSGHRLFADRSV
jgi:hypothetical protein